MKLKRRKFSLYTKISLVLFSIVGIMFAFFRYENTIELIGFLCFWFGFIVVLVVIGLLWKADYGKIIRWYKKYPKTDKQSKKKFNLSVLVAVLIGFVGLLVLKYVFDLSFQLVFRYFGFIVIFLAVLIFLRYRYKKTYLTWERLWWRNVGLQVLIMLIVFVAWLIWFIWVLLST